jgi:hypothetical protein
VIIRNEFGQDLSYDLVHLDSDGQPHRLTIDIAPGGTNYHNVRGTIELLPGLQQQRRDAESISVPITQGHTYVLRADSEGRMTSPEGTWDVFPADADGTN